MSGASFAKPCSRPERANPRRSRRSPFLVSPKANFVRRKRTSAPERTSALCVLRIGLYIAGEPIVYVWVALRNVTWQATARGREWWIPVQSLPWRLASSLPSLSMAVRVFLIFYAAGRARHNVAARQRSSCARLPAAALL